MKHSTSSVKVFGALLLGVAIGGGLGILFAPNKGSKTRKRILAKGSDMSDALKDKLDTFMDDITDKVDHLKTNLLDRMDGGVSKADLSKKN